MEIKVNYLENLRLEAKFDDFPEIEKKQLVDNYIKDEVLYREAVSLGLDQNDFVIKRRIIQKMEFILNDFDEANVTIPNDSLEAYYGNHQERYYSPAVVTFTHIVFNSDSPYDPQQRAQDFMMVKGHDKLIIAESLPFGDRFLYHRNYAEKTASFLESQFGPSFVETVKGMAADDDIWQGPVKSEHGQHWVKLLTKTTGAVPELQDIIGVVRSDYIGYLKQQHKQKRIEKLLKKYEVTIDIE
ncbi:MAG: peptidyl-prolyl cis-trans isomerase [Proteobacteria bacterium]|nr:peptidyl-prolyl cis-trans isomerase [Pseudomonadota bacterium]